MTVLELINLLETCEDTFEVIIPNTDDVSPFTIRVTGVQQFEESKQVYLCTTDG